MPRKINKWVASDDSEFSTEEEANLHEKKMEFSDWFENNRIEGGGLALPHPIHVYKWMEENKVAVQEFLDNM